MSKLIELFVTLSILPNGLTPIQEKAGKWFEDNSIPTPAFERFIAAAVFPARMALWLASRRRNDIAIKTFGEITDWDACVPYAGTISATGYAPTSFRRRVFKAFYGPLPAETELNHICHDPATCVGGITCPHRACCNVLHMQVSTHEVNHRRSNRGGASASRTGTTRRTRKPACKHGHQMTPENTLVLARGERACKTCNAERQARFTAKAKVIRSVSTGSANTHPKGRRERSSRP